MDNPWYNQFPHCCRVATPIWTLSSILLLAVLSKQQECPQELDSSSFEYPRVFITRLVGPASVIANETTAARNLRTCRSTIEHATEMRRYFETFGIDLSEMSNPYVRFDDARFTVAPYAEHPDTDYRLILSTFYECAQVADAPVTYLFWSLFAKSDLRGAGRTLPAGYLSLYGMLR